MSGTSTNIGLRQGNTVILLPEKTASPAATETSSQRDDGGDNDASTAQPASSSKTTLERKSSSVLTGTDADSSEMLSSTASTSSPASPVSSAKQAIGFISEPHSQEASPSLGISASITALMPTAEQTSQLVALTPTVEPTSSPSSLPATGMSPEKTIGISIASSLIGATIVGAVLWFFCRKRRQKSKTDGSQNELSSGTSLGSTAVPSANSKSVSSEKLGEMFIIPPERFFPVGPPAPDNPPARLDYYSHAPDHQVYEVAGSAAPPSLFQERTQRPENTTLSATAPNIAAPAFQITAPVTDPTPVPALIPTPAPAAQVFPAGSPGPTGPSNPAGIETAARPLLPTKETMPYEWMTPWDSPPFRNTPAAVSTVESSPYSQSGGTASRSTSALPAASEGVAGPVRTSQWPLRYSMMPRSSGLSSGLGPISQPTALQAGMNY